jgi:hypothetical protein
VTITRPWQLLIEGAHRTGKDKLAHQICLQSDWQHSVQVRGFISNYAFSLLQNRPVPAPWQVMEDLKQLQRFAIVHVVHRDVASLGPAFHEKHPAVQYSNSELASIIRGCCRLAKQGYELYVIEVDALSADAEQLAAEVLRKLDALNLAYSKR